MNINKNILTAFLLSCATAWCQAADPIPLSIATQNYPHIQAISSGTIAIPECRISYTTATLLEIERKLEQKSAGDILEIDFAKYLIHFSTKTKHDWVLVPVFLWREFPHHHMKIKDGKVTVDIPSESLLTWARGIASSSPTLKPPFADAKTVEQDYFRETRIFPIVTVLAVRRELVDANPWLPEALFIAFSEAKSKAMEEGTLPLPWGPENRDETIELMKKNYWSYGVYNNPKTLHAIFKYAHEQGLTAKELKPDDVFSLETLMLIDEKGAKN